MEDVLPATKPPMAIAHRRLWSMAPSSSLISGADLAANPTVTATAPEEAPTTATPTTRDTTTTKAELRRLKNRRKRHARAAKRRKRAEEEARCAKTYVEQELRPLKKALKDTTAALEAAKKELAAAGRAITGRKRKRVGEDEQAERPAGKKKKNKYYPPVTKPAVRGKA
jgi:seryl-tRNA synthetase